MIALKSLFHKNYLLNFTTHPLFISLVISIIIILTLPPIFNKYKVEIIQRTKIIPGQTTNYADLNNDGVSEKIIFDQFLPDFFILTIFDNGKIINQWNFSGKLIHTLKPMVERIGSDSSKSIYFFYFKNNKIYLNCLNPFEDKFLTKDKFVIEYIPRNKDLGCSVYPCLFYDSIHDKINEFYFGMEAGYSVQPRRVFKYDPAKDTLFTSAKSYAAITYWMIADTSNSDFNLIFSSDAVGNSKITDPGSDRFAWLLDFNYNLSLKYKPIKIGFYPSHSSIVQIELAKRKYFIVMNIYAGTGIHTCSLRLFDLNLKLIREEKFQYSPEWDQAYLYSYEEQYHIFI